ncbi:MAG TPA: Wzz/FepE/Etk N-terminal domain-containing protein [Bacillota bacterium]|nr:Wzz/FepE/Etk N-terminal domain-containing protein [Bacillota bacterium]
MEETISLQEILVVIRKRLLLIVGLIIGAALIAAIVSFFLITDKYESTAQFIVNQKLSDQEEDFNVNDIRTNVELINTYNVIIKSPAILDNVIDELNLPYKTDKLSEKIDVTSEEESQVVTVTATDPSPEMATKLANTTVEMFQAEVPEIMNGVDNVNILSKAKTEDDPKPVSPKPLLNIAIAIVLGGMIGVGLAFLLEYLDNTIHTENDLEQKVGLPVLGTISHIEDSDVRSDPLTFQQNQAKRGDYNGAQKDTI